MACSANALLFVSACSPLSTFTLTTNQAFVSKTSFKSFPAPQLNRAVPIPRRTPVKALLSLPQQRIAIALSLPALPIVGYSEYVLLTSGCGLPPGPYGLLGAAEGISYLVVAAIVLLSVFSKVKTGSGLPEGPGKLLGASEGVAFLLAFAGVAIAGYTFYKFGSLPSGIPTPGDRCFPVEQ